jgi:hypothetical protein
LISYLLKWFNLFIVLLFNPFLQASNKRVYFPAAEKYSALLKDDMENYTDEELGSFPEELLKEAMECFKLFALRIDSDLDQRT